MIAIILRTDIATTLFFIFYIKILEIFIIETDIWCVVGTFTCISLLLLLLGQLFGFIYLLMSVMGVVWEISKSIVHIHTFMIEQLGKRHHSSILKIFSKTSCHQMHMNPSYILWCKYLHIKILRIFSSNIDKLLLLCNNSFPLFFNWPHQPFIFKIF